MAFFSWSRWLRSLCHFKVKPIHKRRIALRLEQLETRLAPSATTFIWTGAGPDNKWSDAKNWSDATGTAPTGSGSEDLIFPNGPSVVTAQNDIAGAGGKPAIFNSITLSGSGYDLKGLPITLGGATAISGATGELNVNAAAAGEIIEMPITLGGAGSGQQNVTIGAAADLTFTSTAVLSSSPGTPGWTKLGTGTLILNAKDTFSEPFTIAQGVVQIGNASALGTSTTTVQQNAQLALNNTGAVANALVISGFGRINDGVLLSMAGANALSGTITLDNNSYLGASAGSVLNISGAIQDNGAGYAINKEGAGQIILSHANTYRGATTVDDGILTIQDPNALGNSASYQNAAIVNTGVTGSGTLQLDDEKSAGFVVANELLTINGFGAGGVFGVSGEGAARRTTTATTRGRTT